MTLAPSKTEAEIVPQLSLQQEALATAMLHRLGNAATNFSIRDGINIHQNPEFGPDDFASLVDKYRDDPKDSLAWARESLFDIATDKKLDGEERSERVDRYLDAYFDLMIKLDHGAFPDTQPGDIREGVPDYIPDGFVDMGGESELDSGSRGREMIQVDKAAILQKYKPFIKGLFSEELGEMPLQKRKSVMFAAIAREVYFTMPYSNKDLGGSKPPLSQIDDTVCRHHALVFQVLAQTLGLKSQILKSYFATNGDTLVEKHSTNLVRLNGQWHILDSTGPDVTENSSGKKEWRPGVFEIDGPPVDGERKRWDVVTKYSGQKRTYIAHDHMYWFIEKVPKL